MSAAITLALTVTGETVSPTLEIAGDDVSLSLEIEQPEITLTLTPSEPGPAAQAEPDPVEIEISDDVTLDAEDVGSVIFGAPGSGVKWTVTTPEPSFEIGIRNEGLGEISVLADGATPYTAQSVHDILISDLQAVGLPTIIVPGSKSRVWFDNAGTIPGKLGVKNTRVDNAGTAGSYIAYSNVSQDTPWIDPLATRKTDSVTQSPAPVVSNVTGLVGSVDRFFCIVISRSKRVQFPDNPHCIFHIGGTTSANNQYLKIDIIGGVTNTEIVCGSSVATGTTRATISVPNTSIDDAGFVVISGTYTASSQLRQIYFNGTAGTASSLAAALHPTNTIDRVDLIPAQRLGNNNNTYYNYIPAALVVGSDLSKRAATEAVLMAYAAKLNAGTLFE